MNPAVVLTDTQLIAITKDARYAKHWVVQSLLRTLWHDRDEAKQREEANQFRVGELQHQLQWFESTYNTRFGSPLRKRRVGRKCPHCHQEGVVQLGEYRACLECQQTWSQEDEDHSDCTVVRG